MKKLTDADIEQMAEAAFTPDDAATRRNVRTELHLSQRIPVVPGPLPDCITIDLHNHTEDESWSMITDVINSGVKHAKIITGASGILKIKFQQWAHDSVISPYIVSITPINNGSFDVKIRKH